MPRCCINLWLNTGRAMDMHHKACFRGGSLMQGFKLYKTQRIIMQ